LVLESVTDTGRIGVNDEEVACPKVESLATLDPKSGVRTLTV
jgi:hypothetical protein